MSAILFIEQRAEQKRTETTNMLREGEIEAAAHEQEKWIKRNFSVVFVYELPFKNIMFWYWFSKKQKEKHTNEDRDTSVHVQHRMRCVRVCDRYECVVVLIVLFFTRCLLNVVLVLARRQAKCMWNRWKHCITLTHIFTAEKFAHYTVPIHKLFLILEISVPFTVSLDYQIKRPKWTRTQHIANKVAVSMRYYCEQEGECEGKPLIKWIAATSQWYATTEENEKATITICSHSYHVSMHLHSPFELRVYSSSECTSRHLQCHY